MLPRSFATLRKLAKAAREQKPHALVVIDYPDFNFRLMRLIKKLGIPVIYYVSPQLWAWRAGPHQADEAQRRSRAADLSVRRGDLPAARIDVRFVGHPLIDLAQAEPDARGVPARS